MTAHRSHPRVESSKQAEAARTSLAKARQVERHLPRSAAQRAADSMNGARAHVNRAKLTAAERTWVAKGEAAWHRGALKGEATWKAKGAAAWHRGEATYIAKGRAAWIRGEAVWKAKGAAAWRAHAHHGSLGHSLHPAARAPLGSRRTSTTLHPKAIQPHILGEPQKFARQISPTAYGQRTAWRRAHAHHFKKVLRMRKPRRSSIGKWRRSRRRVTPR